MSRYERHRHGRARSSGVAAMARRVSLFGVATAAILALYRQFRSIVLAIAPAYSPDLDCDVESERNRAGRLAELKVAQLWVGLPFLFLQIVIWLSDFCRLFCFMSATVLDVAFLSLFRFEAKVGISNSLWEDLKVGATRVRCFWRVSFVSAVV